MECIKDTLLRISEENQNTARNILQELQLFELWREAGARVALVGSLRTGLMLHHLDIDVHVYTKTLDVAASFSVVSRIAAHTSVTKVYFINSAQTDEQCFEWHIFYQDTAQNTWQIDMIQILAGSRYDGHFECVADAVTQKLQPQLREQILYLKHSCGTGIPGIAFCRAVLDAGIVQPEAFNAWYDAHKNDDLMHWMPHVDTDT